MLNDDNKAFHQKSDEQNSPFIDSEQLFHGATRLLIRHKNENYSLQITRNERLILIKV